MKDFNSYKPEDSAQGGGEDISDLAQRLTAAFAGKGEGDVLRAIYAEAEKSRRAGTLSDADLDNFYNALSPMLDGAKRKKLAFVIGRLKKM
ncbi:MAG TPA: hypothetical protein H9727_03665 [Candidatus Borkfalkia avistercoris]|uniref:Uncharacterized protein n=1 Tax=Candidatus Borkfalkia avistercoris TaxID=2838504 RepID=A0A9D2IE01_9FIRM|nr:hypothetical protein [Candidatus Borkfalkia avistercoris]